jgi:hypothetical protein
MKNCCTVYLGIKFGFEDKNWKFLEEREFLKKARKLNINEGEKRW